MRLTDAQQRIEKALVDAQRERSERDDWIEFERSAVHRAAKELAAELRLPPPDESELTWAEQCATGHCDYTRKFALYAAEAALGIRRQRT